MQRNISKSLEQQQQQELEQGGQLFKHHRLFSSKLGAHDNDLSQQVDPDEQSVHQSFTEARQDEFFFFEQQNQELEEQQQSSGQQNKQESCNKTSKNSGNVVYRSNETEEIQILNNCPQFNLMPVKDSMEQTVDKILNLFRPLIVKEIKQQQQQQQQEGQQQELQQQELQYIINMPCESVVQLNDKVAVFKQVIELQQINLK